MVSMSPSERESSSKMSWEIFCCFIVKNPRNEFRFDDAITMCKITTMLIRSWSHFECLELIHKHKFKNSTRTWTLFGRCFSDNFSEFFIISKISTPNSKWLWNRVISRNISFDIYFISPSHISQILPVSPQQTFRRVSHAFTQSTSTANASTKDHKNVQAHRRVKCEREEHSPPQTNEQIMSNKFPDIYSIGNSISSTAPKLAPCDVECPNK